MTSALRVRRLPGIRSLLLATYLVVLLLPVAGIGILRLYESALIRQTETELLAQAAVLSAAYRASWLERAPAGALQGMPEAQMAWRAASTYRSPERWEPLFPQLDLADTPVLPRAPEAQVTDRSAEPIARQIAPSLSSVVSDVRTMTLAGIRIVDPWGVVVVSSGTADLNLSLIGQEEVAEALKGTPTAKLRERLVSGTAHGLESISRNSDIRVFVAVPVLAEGRVLGAVLVSRTPRDIVQTLYGKRYALLALGGILLATVVALAWFTGRAVVRPTRQLADMARRLASREIRSVQPLTAPMTREAQSLSDSIVALARALEARADYVRDLALGISHEFKTPITGIRGGVELLRDHLTDMSVEERQKFLANILTDTERLERLLNRVLELARADALTPRGDEICNVTDATNEAVDSVRQLRCRVAEVSIPASLFAAIDRASFDVILSNLLENARQHGGAGVTVAVSARVEAGTVMIEVSDDGPGISTGNADRIFDRFFTTARKAGGTGLGLAIARQRAMAFGGDVVLLPSDRGATFRIALPAAPQTPR
jgi:signal transduction histidine kinase